MVREAAAPVPLLSCFHPALVPAVFTRRPFCSSRRRAQVRAWREGASAALRRQRKSEKRAEGSHCYHRCPEGADRLAPRKGPRRISLVLPGILACPPLPGP